MRPVTTGAILAAGMGSRLHGLGIETPKGFLQLGARPIVEESILRLRSVGCERIVVITGHLAEFYEGLRARYPDLIETVHNNKFASSGTMYSLWCARNMLTEDFLLLESDLIYERRGLTACLDSPHASTVLLSGPTGAGDEVYAETEEGRLINLSKNAARLNAPSAGEFVGITKLAQPVYRAMLAAAQSRFASSLEVSYETDILAHVAQTIPIHCLVVPDLCWSEIDDPQHHRRASELVYPEILRRDREWLDSVV